MNVKAFRFSRAMRGMTMVFLAALCSTSLKADPAGEFPTLTLSEAGGPARLKDRLFLTRLPAGREATWSEIARRPRAEWTALRSPAFSGGYSGDVFYLRVALKNTSETPIWYLRVLNNRLDRADFRLDTAKGFVEHRAGDHRPWTGKEPAAYPVFRFKLSPGESGVLFIRLRSTAMLDMRFRLESAEEFGGARRQHRLVEIGILIMVFLLIVIQYLLYRRREAEMQIYFILTMIFGGLWMWVRFGDGPLYLYPGSVFLKDNGVFLFIIPATVFAYLFLRKFLDMRITSPLMDRLLLYSAFLPLLSLPFIFMDIEIRLKNILSSGVIPINASLLLAAFIMSLRAKRRWLIHIFISWLVFLTAAAFHYAMIFHYLPYYPPLVDSMVFTVPVWLVFGLGAMAWRVRALKRERDDTLERMVELLRDASGPPPEETGNGASRAKTSPAAASARRVRALDTESLLEALMRLVREERLYVHEELTMEDFADRLGIRPDQLSALLNLKLGVSFSRLINQHRIDEACRRLVENPEHTVLRIGLDCGFGSRTAFNREFKRHVGLTPAAYRAQHTDRDEVRPT